MCNYGEDVHFPGGGRPGIYTGRDQRSMFGKFEFRKSVFLEGTGHSCCIFLGSQINAVFLSVLCGIL